MSLDIDRSYSSVA